MGTAPPPGEGVRAFAHDRLMWFLGAGLVLFLLPLAALTLVLPHAGKAAYAFQGGPDPVALASTALATDGRDSSTIARVASADLSQSTMQFPSTTVTGKVTGGGTIFAKTRNFGFVAQGQVGPGCPATGCPAKGRLNYVNHTTGVHINGPVTAITEFTRNANGTGTATFTGTDKFTGCTFIVSVEDNNEPGQAGAGGSDKFGLDCNGETTSGKQTLSGGNIQIHPPQ